MKNGKLNLLLTAAALAGILSAPVAGAFGATWAWKLVGYSDNLPFGAGVVEDHNARTPENVYNKAVAECDKARAAHEHGDAYDTYRPECHIKIFLNTCGAAGYTTSVFPDVGGGEYQVDMVDWDVRDYGKSTSRDQQLARYAVRKKIQKDCTYFIDHNRDYGLHKIADVRAARQTCDDLKRMYVASGCDTTKRTDFEWGEWEKYKWEAGKKSDEACPPNKPVVNRQGICRVREYWDCGGRTPVLGDDGECRAQVASDCPDNKPVFEKGSCRERYHWDCRGTDTPILDNGECRARTAADCGGGTPVLGDDGECRARTAADCAADSLFLEDGECRKAENNFYERCVAGIEPRRRVFTNPKGMKINGGLEPYGFHSGTFNLSGDLLRDLMRGIASNFRIPSLEGNYGEYAYGRIWLRENGKWYPAAEQDKYEDGGVVYPAYWINGARRVLRAGDVIGVLRSASHQRDRNHESFRKERYNESKEVALFRIYNGSGGKLLIAEGDRRAEDVCRAPGTGFFLRDDFTATDDIEAAGTSFEEL